MSVCYALEDHEHRLLNFLGKPQEGVNGSFRKKGKEEKSVSFLRGVTSSQSEFLAELTLISFKRTSLVNLSRVVSTMPE